MQTGFTCEPIYDTFKTTEIILAGTIAAGARLRFVVNIANLRYNERDDLNVAFARVNLVADSKDDALADLIFTPVPMAPLVEPVRRHNIITRVGFLIENVGGDPLTLETDNGEDDTGQTIPDGLLIQIGGEPAAPLWLPDQERAALPTFTPSAIVGGWSVVDRFNGALPFIFGDITP